MEGVKYQYKLTKTQKSAIAQNLIDILEKDAEITKDTRIFIGDWILTGPDEKRKAFFDVWEIVLNNYTPKSTPILFRSTKRLSKNGKIASFTSHLECASRFNKLTNGYLIICETKALQDIDVISFFPLVDILHKAKSQGGWEFSYSLLDQYILEDEYIMRINLDVMYSFKWVYNF
jgi:hypothetical protein